MPQGQISVEAVDSGALLSGSFDILPYYGQSNISVKSTVATQAFNATGGNGTILQLGNDNTITAAKASYDDITGQQDVASLELAANSTLSGPGSSLANTYQVASGRQVVICPGMLGGAAVVQGAQNQNFQLQAGFPRGNKLRNSPYGSLIARVKNLQALGGTVRFLTYFQGEAEGSLSSTIGDKWPAEVQAMWAQFFIDIGMPGQDKVIFAQVDMQNRAAFPNFANFRAVTQPLAQVAHKYVMVSYPAGPWEADGVHLQGSGCDTLGTAAANAALAEGW